MVRTYDCAINLYPANREADVVLSDGSTVHVRPVRADDEAPIYEFFSGLSLDSRTFRFFSAGTDLRAAARTMVDVDYAARYGLVALRGDDDRVVGQGIYLGQRRGEAEIAFAIADEMQGRGLGTLLLAHLAEVAEENGIPTFVAEVMPDNHRMIEVFRESGLPLEISSQPGAIRVEMPTSFSPEAIERFEQRDRLAARAAVRHFLAPRSVAVVGASRTRGTVGGEIFHNLLDSDFDGPVYPVNAGERRRAVGAGVRERRRGPRRDRARSRRGSGGCRDRGREGMCGEGRPGTRRDLGGLLGNGGRRRRTRARSARGLS